MEGPGPILTSPGVRTGASQEPDCSASHMSSLNPVEYWSHLCPQSTYCTAKSSSCGDTGPARQTDQHCSCLRAQAVHADLYLKVSTFPLSLLFISAGDLA